ncbi:MAG: hypothetical protein GXP39_05225 [Chloroflexi bacterium]|nr:hypothetical protein [Chloroflexota bacterium]
MSQLTPRQRAFLAELEHLARERGGPVHYTEVAASLGVSPFSAYDMLKVLEEKGMARSLYVLEARGGGPGRPRVLFLPARRDVAFQEDSEGYNAAPEEWSSFTERILERLRETSQSGYGDLLRDLLRHLPERRRPLLFCAEMTAALLINLARVRSRIADTSLVDVLSGLLVADEIGLGTLAGLSLGSTLNMTSDRHLLETLYANVQRYQKAIHGLNEESQRRLSEFLQEAIHILAGRQRPA